MRTSRFLA